MERHP
jgi:protein phosphatase PTC7